MSKFMYDKVLDIFMGCVCFSLYFVKGTENVGFRAGKCLNLWGIKKLEVGKVTENESEPTTYNRSENYCAVTPVSLRLKPLPFSLPLKRHQRIKITV